MGFRVSGFGFGFRVSASGFRSWSLVERGRRRRRGSGSTCARGRCAPRTHPTLQIGLVFEAPRLSLTQLKAQGPSRTCNESKEEEEEQIEGVVVLATNQPINREEGISRSRERASASCFIVVQGSVCPLHAPDVGSGV